MPRRSEIPSSRRHIWVYDEDWEFLEKMFGEALGTGKAIRNIIHNYVGNLQAREETARERVREEKGAISDES